MLVLQGVGVPGLQGTEEWVAEESGEVQEANLVRLNEAYIYIFTHSVCICIYIYTRHMGLIYSPNMVSSNQCISKQMGQF